MADIRVPSAEEVRLVKEFVAEPRLNDYIDKLFSLDYCLTCHRTFLIYDAMTSGRGCAWHPGRIRHSAGAPDCCDIASIPGCASRLHAFASLGHTPYQITFPEKIVPLFPRLGAPSLVISKRSEMGRHKALYEALETSVFGRPSELAEQPVQLGSREIDMSQSFYQSSLFMRSTLVNGTHLVTDETLPVSMHVFDS